jgi:Tfp pilus assembly protein PilN
MSQIEARLAAKRDALRGGAVKMPPASEFERLRSRIEALNKLDFEESVGVGDLLDTLEAILPDHVVITSLDYDRAVRTIDLAAVSASSDDLTAFFDALYRTGMFSQVRLVDKLQIEADGGGAQTQVRMALQVGRQSLRGAGRTEAKS